MTIRRKIAAAQFHMGVTAVIFLFSLLGSLVRNPEECLYYVQAAIYLSICSAIRDGRHETWQEYLLAAAIYIGIGMLHHWPHG